MALIKTAAIIAQGLTIANIDKNQSIPLSFGQHLLVNTEDWFYQAQESQPRIPHVQEVLQRIEIGVFRRALDIAVGISMIRAL